MLNRNLNNDRIENTEQAKKLKVVRLKIDKIIEFQIQCAKKSNFFLYILIKSKRF